jgi:hypothetical protein
MMKINPSRFSPPTSPPASCWTTVLRQGPRALSIALIAVISGCGEEPDEAEPIGVVTEAVENMNALNPNALNPNALNPNALNPNALNPNALNPNALSPAALYSLQLPDEAGSLSRQFLKYVVSCAFDSAQSFSFSWADVQGVHNETYPGLLGLATSWSNAPLSLEGQQWVSACLASRVNWYGVSVVLSSRASNPALDKEGLPEILTYLQEEGAFWGNLFTASPAVFSCNNPLSVSHARTQLRDCSSGHRNDNGSIQECGIIHVVGSCALYCQPLDLFGLYHPRCVSDLEGNWLLAPLLNNSTASTAAITVFLN